MPQIKRSAMMPYPAEVMYDIVNDVGRYPEFLPWCGGVEIRDADERSLEASIEMKLAGLNHWFTTRNRMVPGQTIEISLVDGPFRRLEGYWRFTPIDSDGCRIELTMDFEIRQGLVGAVMAPAFSRIANTMVESFCQRARELYE